MFFDENESKAYKPDSNSNEFSHNEHFVFNFTERFL